MAPARRVAGVTAPMGAWDLPDLPRSPAHRCSAPTSLTPLCTSLLPSPQRPESIRGIASNQPETFSLCSCRGGEGAARPPQPLTAGSPSTARSRCARSPSALAQHLRRARGGRAQGQRVPESCGKPGMRQQGLGDGRAPQQEGSPAPTPAWPTPSPAGCRGPAQESRGGAGAKLPGKGGQRARERWYLPHPSTPAW